MKVGDYVRTKSGQIHKITDLKGFYENGKLIEDKQSVYIDNKCSGWLLWQFKEFVIKKNPNIIDLIEVGDFITYKKDNMYFNIPTRVSAVFDELTLSMVKFVGNEYLNKVEITSIVTKEQFENMKYEVR